MNKEVKNVNLTWLSRTGLTNLNSGEGGTNFIDIKKYRWQGNEYPYVSGQAMRFYLKESIRRKVRPEEICIGDEQGETCGQIDKCLLCDLFGFMITDIGAKTRISPVKVAPAMGLLPFRDSAVVDFLTRKKRGLQAEERRGDIVNVELAVNIYKSGLSLDIARVGSEEKVFEIREIPGKKVKKVWGVQWEERITIEEKARRVRLLLEAVKDFSDYSKQARLLTDFTPDIIIGSIQKNYSHNLQKALELKKDKGVLLNIDRLKECISEVRKESINIFAGILTGVIDNEDEMKNALEGMGIQIQTPKQALDNLMSALGI